MVSLLFASQGLLYAPHSLAAQDAPVRARVSIAPQPGVPDLARVRTATEAARVLRDLWANQDFNTAADIGAQLVKRFPGDQRVAAWWALVLRRTSHGDRGDSVAARLDSSGRDPVVSALRSATLAYPLLHERDLRRTYTRRLEDAVRRTRDVDFAWLLQESGRALYTGDYARGAAYTDSVAVSLGNPALLRVRALDAKYVAERYGKPTRDTAVTNAILRDVISAARDNANDARMLQMAYDVAGYDDRSELEMQFATMLAARTPRSNALRSEYWYHLDLVKAIPQAERRTLIDLDRRQLLSLVDSAPWALSSVLSSVKRTHPGSPDIPALEAAIIRRAPRSAWHERILASRVSAWNDSINRAFDTTRSPRPDTTQARRGYVAAAEAFLAKGWQAEASQWASITLNLALILAGDSTAPADQLVRAARGMLARERLNGPHLVIVANGLAKRGLAPRLADSLARRGEALSLASMRMVPSRSVGEMAEQMDAIKANTHDALGHIALREKRFDVAEKHFADGLELTKRNADLYLHIGMLRQAQGRPDDAELAWAEGMTVRTRGANPNRRELEALYRAKHGSLDGWSTYVATLEAKERSVRKARILGKTVETPVIVPTMPIATLAGDTLSHQAHKGKVTVVNFWGTWCGPCVAEMPEIQHFYDKYKNDAGVRVITVSNDADRETLVKWMGEKKYTIPTAWSKPYTSDANISAWPTTWFIAPDGTVKYALVGNAGLLVEEWSWIVEALRGNTP